MRIGLLAGAALALGALLSTQAHATGAVSWTDIAGDANGINGQGSGHADGGIATPVQHDAADILEVSIETTKVKKKVTGYEVSVKLGAKPEAGIGYRLFGRSGPCTQFWLEHRKYLAGTTATRLRTSCGGTDENFALKPGVETADSLTFVVPLTKLPKGVKVGSRVEGMAMETRGLVGGPMATDVTAPALDYAYGFGQSYRIGS